MAAISPVASMAECEDDDVVSYHALRGERRRQRKGMVEKRSWSHAEDLFLRQLVASMGGPTLTLSWTQIATEFSEHHSNRSGKQCRERFANHLHPDVRKGGWTKEEDLTIRRLQQELGNQWAKMVRYLPGRSDNSIKNRFWSFQRSKERKRERVMAASSRLPRSSPVRQATSSVALALDRKIEIEVTEQRRYKENSLKDHITIPYRNLGLGQVPEGIEVMDSVHSPSGQGDFDGSVPILKRRRVSDDSSTTTMPAGTPYARPFAPDPRAFMQGQGPPANNSGPVNMTTASPQARYASLAKMVSIGDSDSDDDDIIGQSEATSPAPKGYAHLPLGPTVSETHSPVSSPSTATATDTTTASATTDVSTEELERGLGLSLVAPASQAPAVSGVRFITDEELSKSRIIFNWPMTADNKPFTVGKGN
ncbi:hypothetical protein TrST_g6664 [Triparma strigata]|uniref:Uncharacterized protein n=1 Tax=Triparma strigata TaxID=1606541 RepID=A0A9W7BV13_9STRA|nr:hypothetical protein TrST_g6664 [Triparma strigata]